MPILQYDNNKSSNCRIDVRAEGFALNMPDDIASASPACTGAAHVTWFFVSPPADTLSRIAFECVMLMR